MFLDLILLSNEFRYLINFLLKSFKSFDSYIILVKSSYSSKCFVQCINFAKLSIKLFNISISFLEIDFSSYS